MNNAPSSIKLPSSGGAQKTGQQSNASAAREPANAAGSNGMFQDILAVTGVDLKAESEMIQQQAESSLANKQQQQDQQQQQQPVTDESKQQNFVPQQQQHTLSSWIRKIAHNEQLEKVEQDVDSFIAMALYERMRWIVEQSVKASNARVDYLRDKWQIDLLDGEKALKGCQFEQQQMMDEYMTPVGDEGEQNANKEDGQTAKPSSLRSRIGAVKRPLIWIERQARVEEARIARELGASISEEGANALLDSSYTLPTPAAAPQKTEKSSEPTEEEPKESAAEGEKPKSDEKKAEEKASSKKEKEDGAQSALKEREDMAIRARLANAAALQAAGSSGGSKYSWMNAGATSSTVAATSADSTSADVQQPTEDKDKQAAAVASKKGSSFGGFGLPKPGARKRALERRSLRVEDVLFVLRNDSARGGGWNRLKRCRVVGKAYAMRL